MIIKMKVVNFKVFNFMDRKQYYMLILEVPGLPQYLHPYNIYELKNMNVKNCNFIPGK